MKRSWLWRGFGALLFVGILAGYLPDLTTALALRGARAEGLLALPPAAPIAPQDDARLAYEAAAQKYGDGANLLNNDFVGQTRKPAPHVVKYLDAMAAASRLPACSPISDEYDGRAFGRPSLDLVFSAARGLVARAKDEGDLLAAARIARHLASQNEIESIGHGSLLTTSVLDRAAKLRLDAAARRRIADAFGPSLAPREILRRHVAKVVADFEAEALKNGTSVSRTRREGAYVRFWRGFFRDAPMGGSTFVEAMRRENGRIERAENDGGQYLDLTGIVGSTPEPWAEFAEQIERANARLKAGR